MRIKTHLVSMPWADVYVPSVQLGALKAHLDVAFPGRFTTNTYSAFCSVFLDAGESDLYSELSEFREFPYFLLALERFIRPRGSVEGAPSLDELLSIVNAPKRGRVKLTKRSLTRLRSATHRYIDAALGPELIRNGVNLVGFTLNYNQVYSSIYCALYLGQRYPDHRCVFVFGGASAAATSVADVLKRLGIRGFGVLGEGEKKLELLAGAYLRTPLSEMERLHDSIPGEVQGIYDIQTNQMDLFKRDPANFASQLVSIRDLGVPDLEEYFRAIRRVFRGAEAIRPFSKNVLLPVEGSRGCFAKCDFCGINVNWEGFRKRLAGDIVKDVLAMIKRYGVRRILFMDNVCDTWAEGYADELIRLNIQIPATMELRAHHPERFWTKLALAGVDAAQVGIESLSSSLIRRMNKGTRARQNILVQKWLKELGIRSLSNLIIGHPRSTMDDIAETQRIIEETPHLGSYSLSDYTLSYGSPLFNQLGPDEMARLRPDTYLEGLEGVERFLVPYYGYSAPEGWFEPGVMEGWRSFAGWYEEHVQWKRGIPAMEVHRVSPGELLIRDERSGDLVETVLDGELACIYDLCHAGMEPGRAAAAAGLQQEKVLRLLGELVERRLALEVEGHFISLALRPRDELLRNHYVASASRETEAMRPTEAKPQARRLSMI
ncbi:radical SAM protein [Sorangium atrum]|uniref:Radical SAM protein n=1 Tax=Sorangium atrum TaxID=2995308 RepID=A0ABT5BW15_9BACT|nr:radical SAM protein [Sorangium aterium]MDC0678361.1 radical SAM protein [Sorangium aterium]